MVWCVCFSFIVLSTTGGDLYRLKFTKLLFFKIICLLCLSWSTVTLNIIIYVLYMGGWLGYESVLQIQIFGLFLAPWQLLINYLPRWILTLRKQKLCLSSVGDCGPERGGQAEGTLAHPIFQGNTWEDWWKKFKLILKQSCSCQGLLKEMHWKISIKARKGYLKSEMTTERQGCEIAGHRLVTLSHNLVWIGGFLSRQVSPIPYSKEHWDNDTYTEKWSHLPWRRLGSHLTS